VKKSYVTVNSSCQIQILGFIFGSKLQGPVEGFTFGPNFKDPGELMLGRGSFGWGYSWVVVYYSFPASIPRCVKKKRRRKPNILSEGKKSAKKEWC